MKKTPKRLWVLLMLSPVMAMLLVVVNGARYDSAEQFIFFGLNPAVTLFGAYWFCRSPDRNKAKTAAIAIPVGIIFSGINLMIGFFACFLCYPTI